MFDKKFTLGRLFVFTAVFCLTTLFALDGTAQKRQAVIVVRPSATTVGDAVCSGSLELVYHLVGDPKLNGKEDILMLNSMKTDDGGAAQISRQSYENAAEVKLKSLYAVSWYGNDVLAATNAAGQTPVPIVPNNLKPAKNVQMPLSSFYSVTLTGEAQDGRSKRKINLGLREIWKIYFILEGANVNDTLFAHAAEEKSVAVWEAFLRKTNNYRSGEANSQMRDALLGCSQKHLEEFRQGNYNAAGEARTKAERARAVRGDEAVEQLLGTISREKQKVDDTIGQVEQLLRQSRFDDAVTTAEPVVAYIRSRTDLNKLYADALQKSHDAHLDKGEKALLNNQLEVARNECETARKRLPDSTEARTCVCESGTRISLRDADNLLKQKKPKLAKEMLEKQLANAECARNVSITDKLNGAKCEYARQLLTEARQTTGGNAGAQSSSPGKNRKPQSNISMTGSVTVKAVTAMNRNFYRESREKLSEAQAMCESEEGRNLLEAVNQKLADFNYDRANTALRNRSYGTAYVYLQAAQKYAPNDGRVGELLDRARNEFNEKTRVNIGIVFNNKSGVNTGDLALEQVRGAIESITADVNLSQPNILEPRQAVNALSNIRSQTSPTAIFTFNLLSFSFNKTQNPRSVRSSYSYTNERWSDADRQHDAMEREWKNCRKVSGDAGCGDLKARYDRQRTYRDSIQKTLTEYYSYRENTITIRGNVRMTYLFNNSIAAGSVGSSDTLESALNNQCIEREGVNPKDNSTRDQQCNLSDEDAYFEGMINNIRTQAISAAAQQLRAMPFGYYKSAKSTADKNAAAEKYILYLFLTDQKDSAEAREAQRLLLSIDPELETNGILQ